MITVIIKVMKMTIKHPKNSYQWLFQIPKKTAREHGIVGKERIMCNRYRHQTQNPHTGKNMYASFSEILCPWKTSNTTRCKCFKGKLGAVQITCLASFNTNRTQNSKEPPSAEGVFPCLFNFDSLKLYFAGVGFHTRLSLNGKSFKQFVDSASKGSFNKA